MEIRIRQTPFRTCLVCDNKTDKSLLVRIVVTDTGEVKIDKSGKIKGRGTYVCAQNSDCDTSSLNRSRLNHALRTNSRDKDWDRIHRQFQCNSD